PGRVVELQVAAADVVEGTDRLAIGLPDVVKVLVEIGIDGRADGAAALAEMERARSRDGHLRRDLGVVLEEPEMLEVRMAREADLAHDAHAFRLGLDAGELDPLPGGIELGAVEALEEIELPPGAPEFAVGRELETDGFLLADDFLDLAVFDLLQLRGRDLAFRM